MEYGTFERRVRIDAVPAIVYEVVSTQQHIRNWLFDDAEFESTPGASGVLRFGGPGRESGEIPITVVDAVRGERFAFLWVAPPAPTVDGPLTRRNSALVTFTLEADGDGTLLTVREEGIRELGWEAAVLEDYYSRHGATWDRLLAGLPGYVASLARA